MYTILVKKESNTSLFFGDAPLDAVQEPWLKSRLIERCGAAPVASAEPCIPFAPVAQSPLWRQNLHFVKLVPDVHMRHETYCLSAGRLNYLTN